MAQPVSARLVPEGPPRPRRAVLRGGEEGTAAAGPRKRLATALSLDPKVSADSDTAKLQELVLASIPKEVAEGMKDMKELATVVKSQGETLLQHAEILRVLRGTAMEQDNRVKASLVKLNLTVEAVDKLGDGVELIEVDQAAVTSDFKELQAGVAEMKAIIETKEVEQDAKLLRLVEQRHMDVHALTAELQGKMAMVEGTFVQVEGLLYTLKQCHEKHDRLMSDVSAQATTGDAGQGSPAVLMEMAQLKQRMDAAGKLIAQNSECAKDVKQAANDLEEKQVTLETRLQEFVVVTNSQASEYLARVVAEREQAMCVQIETALVEISKHACRCPGNCPGAAPGQQPPGFGAQPPATGAPTRVPFLGSNGQFNSGGGCGGGEPPRGGRAPGGGGSGPGPTAHHEIFSDDGHAQHRRLTKASKSPFDSKAAKDELPRYDGKVKPELWRKKVTYYLHSKNANMQNLLRWAELQTEPITTVMLANAANEVNSLAMLSDDPEVLSYHLWGFLNVNLVDAAWDLFDGVDMENGLEVWRVVNLEMTQKTQSELLALEDAVLTPSRVSEIKDIDRALVAWDAAYRTYLEAGGTSLSKPRQVGAIMRLIPVKVRDQALWEFDKFDGKPEVLRKWIRDRTQWFIKADVGRPGGARAHVFDGDGFDASEDFPEQHHRCVDCRAECMADEELCPFGRKKFQQGQRARPGGGAPTRPQDRQAPPRDKRDFTCPNCLKKGHTSQECREPKLASKDRKCFTCGEAGHVASKCPNAKRAQVLMGPSDSGDKPVWLGGDQFCCIHDAGEVPVHRKGRTPLSKALVMTPKPRGCTLGDCMGRAFAQLAKIEREEDERRPEPVRGSSSTSRPVTGSEATLDSSLMSCSAKPSPATGVGARKKAWLRSKGPDFMSMPFLEITSKRFSENSPWAPSGADMPTVPMQLHSFWGIEEGAELNVAEEEPEYIEVEMTLDTGATVHAADRVDFPGCHVLESPGSRAGQHFQTAAKKTIPNEGQANIALSTNGVEMAMMVQIAKISRPLLSVTKMTESGDLTVLCKKDEALILDAKGKTVAAFPKRGGLYICMMKYKNPRYQSPEDFPRPHA